MDTQSLKLFVLAAEKLNISAAGRNLGMAPAVASARLAKLERQLRSQLLHRSTRKVSLSVEGAEFLPYAKEILAQEVAALDAMGHGRSEPTGTLRFAASSTFAQLYIVPLIPDFLERYPCINLDLRLSDTSFNLIEGSFDLALRNMSLNDSSLKARKLADDKRLLVASPNYLQKYGIPKAPEDLLDHKLIGFLGNAPRRLLRNDGQTAQFNPQGTECRLLLDDGLSQKLVTQAGAGISANSLWSVHSELVSGELVHVLPDYIIDDEVAIWLVYPQANIMNAKVRVFIDFLLEEVGEHPVWNIDLNTIAQFQHSQK
jgi:DNA-binding transcriptional LysR family regulator